MDGDEDQWDPATYITVELQPYARAYATMLTRCLHRTLNRKENKKLNHPTMLALVNLLRSAGWLKPPVRKPAA
jgi:hypothetical protein